MTARRTQAVEGEHAPTAAAEIDGAGVRFGSAAGNRETGGAVLPHADASARRARALWHPTIMLIRDSIPEAPHDLYRWEILRSLERSAVYLNVRGARPRVGVGHRVWVGQQVAEAGRPPYWSPLR